MSWFWKSDDDWKEYAAADSAKIEKAFQKKQKTVQLNDTYKVNFKDKIQFRMDDPDKQRDIKRVDPPEKKGKKRGKEEETEEVEAPNKKGKNEPEKVVQFPKRLQHDLKLTKDAEAKGDLSFSMELIDDDLYKWELKLSEFDPESQLAKDLVLYNKKHGVNFLTLRFYFPVDYPVTAPLVHIVTPKLVGAFISGGGLCMSILMQGWSSAITPESLLLHVRQLFMEGNVRINNINKVESYSEVEARQGFLSVKSAHANDPSFA